MQQSSRSVIFSSLLALLLVGGVFFYFQFKNWGVTPTPAPTPSGFVRYVPTLGGEQFNITRMGKLTFPAIVSTTSSPQQNLPEDIKDLIYYGVSGSKIQSVAYEGKKTGWKITFSVSEPLQTLHIHYASRLGSNYGWERLYSARGHYVAVVDARKGIYEVRASSVQPDLGIKKTDVILDIIIP